MNRGHRSSQLVGTLLPFLAAFSVAGAPTEAAATGTPKKTATTASAKKAVKSAASAEKRHRGRVPSRKTEGGQDGSASPAFVAGPDGPIVGVPVEGDYGITVTMAELERRQSFANRTPRVRPIKPEHELEREDLPDNPDAPALSQWPPSQGDPAFRVEAGENGVGALAPQAKGIQIAGPTLTDTGAFPPDTMGAVGPTQYIVAVNGRIRSYSKTTGAADGAIDLDQDVFFSSVMTPPTSTNFTSDPRIRFDRLSNRWIAAIIDVPGGSGALPNRVLLAVSNAETVTSGSAWTFFQFQGDPTNFADYPTLGVDADALYIGANMFSPAGSFVNTNGYVVRKSSILGAGPIVVTKFASLATGSGAGPYTPQGVDNPDPANTGASAVGYFIGVDNASFGTLALRRVTSPGGASPTMSANLSLTVPTTRGPVLVPHLGNTGGSNGRLDALDDRLYAATLRNGRIWTAHSVGVNNTGVSQTTTSNNRNGVRWYEIRDVATTPALVQAGTLYDNSATNDANQRNYWIPSIMVSGQGHAALGSSIAGTNERINAFTTGRLSGDTLGTLRDGPGGTAFPGYTSSTTAYNPAGDAGGTGGRRWGDYSYTSLDPCDDMTMWTIQEFCQATDSYRVEALQLLAPPPATPSCATPTNVAQGASNVSVPIVGTSTSGSGFYDTPATGMPPCRRRLAAAVSGSGVTVNGVTYTDPTHVTLNVSVAAGAATGARTVTFTNPDGQTSQGACLNVTVGCPTVTAAVTGGGATCAGSGSTVTVTITGGASPYTVTLTNGGGTQTGASPLTFNVSPSATTAYAVSSGSDSNLCAVTGSGSATVTVNPIPSTPVISAEALVGSGSPNRIASVASHVGSTYAWGITNGTIVSGQGTSRITYTAGASGSVALAVIETFTATGCSSATARLDVPIGPFGSAVLFYPVTPCRIVDTRNAAGPLGGPALAPSPATRTFTLTGTCGIPATAKSISANVTVTGQSVGGSLRVYDASLASPPEATVISFAPSRTRANNAIIRLATDGTGAITVRNDAAGTVHFVLDVNGYFE